MKLFSYNFQNKAENKNEVEINIDGIIGAYFSGSEDSKNTEEKINNFIKQIKALDVNAIKIKLNSPGGSVKHGLAIRDALAETKASVEIKVYGMTASAATIIATAADKGKLSMSKNALFLIHRAWVGVIGNQNEIDEAKKTLEAIDNILIDIYSERTGKSKEEITELMDENNGNGKWLSAADAKKYGLIDSVFNPSENTDLNAFKAELLENVMNFGFQKPDELTLKTIFENNIESQQQSQPQPKKQNKSKTLINNILKGVDNMSNITIIENMKAKAIADGADASEILVFDKMLEGAKKTEEELNAFKQKEIDEIKNACTVAHNSVLSKLEKLACPEEIRAEIKAIEIDNKEAQKIATKLLNSFEKAISNIKTPGSIEEVTILTNNKEPEEIKNWNK